MTTHLSSELFLQLSERIESAMGLHFPPDRFYDLDRKIRAVGRLETALQQFAPALEQLRQNVAA